MLRDEIGKKNQLKKDLKKTTKSTRANLLNPQPRS
jgi:hypothetical protein